MDSWPAWLRWILVVPAALAAFVGVQVVITLLSSWQGSWLAFLPDWVIQLVNSLASGVAFVWAPAQVAPRGKTIIGVLFTVTISFISGLITLFGASAPSTVHTPRIVFLLAVLLTVGGAAFACIQVYNEERAAV